MKVLIVSDTHGQDENLEETVLREAPFDYLIHCGDVEGREIFIEALAECPCTIVAGNNDFFTDLPYDEEVTLEGHKILVTHGHHYFVSRDYDKLVENAQAKGCKIAMSVPSSILESLVLSILSTSALFSLLVRLSFTLDALYLAT